MMPYGLICPNQKDRDTGARQLFSAGARWIVALAKLRYLAAYPRIPLVELGPICGARAKIWQKINISRFNIDDSVSVSSGPWTY